MNKIACSHNDMTLQNQEINIFCKNLLNCRPTVGNGKTCKAFAC